MVAYFLVIENNKSNSFWKEYINNLPDNLDEFLYYWDEKKLNLLKSTSLTTEDFYSFNDHIECIKSDFEIINFYNNNYNILDIDEEDFFEEFMKMRILVGSRIFGYEKDNVEESGLIPYVDMINHSKDSNTTWYYDDKKNSFILEATEDINKGDEINDDYGEKNNIDFLLYYGFTLNNNDDPILRIKLENDSLEFTKYNYSELINDENKKEILNILKKIFKIIKNLNKKH